jgi:hypothetical protein
MVVFLLATCMFLDEHLVQGRPSSTINCDELCAHGVKCYSFSFYHTRLCGCLLPLLHGGLYGSDEGSCGVSPPCGSGPSSREAEGGFDVAGTHEDLELGLLSAIEVAVKIAVNLGRGEPDDPALLGELISVLAHRLVACSRCPHRAFPSGPRV